MAGFFSKIFGKTQEAEGAIHPLFADMHSHVLPNLDDGAESPEKALELAHTMVGLGYRKLIMTPHIMGDFYKNTPDGIREKLELLRSLVKQEGLTLELDCAAEYYLDEWFIAKLEKQVELLPFGKEKFLLFETSFINQPKFFNEAVFLIKSAGYRPVLAHPERYTYLYGAFHKLEEMRDSGILLQININSLAGYYSPAAQKIAERMIDKGMVDFAGTDAHNQKHLRALERARASKYYQKLLQLPLLNHQL